MRCATPRRWWRRGQRGAAAAAAQRQSHLLLAHATALPANDPHLARAALPYATAAFPQAALRVCGVPPAAYAAELATLRAPQQQHAQQHAHAQQHPLASAFAREGESGCAHGARAAAVDYTALAEGLAGTGAHSLRPRGRAAKLAMLSGACAGAGGVLEHLLLAAPLECESGALAAVRGAARLGCGGAAARLAAVWVQRCLTGGGGAGSGGSGGGGALGSALSWALGLREPVPPPPAALRAVAARLKRHLDAALRGALCSKLAKATVLGAPPPPATAARPWFPASPVLAGRLGAVAGALEKSGCMGAVDEALATVGHVCGDGEVVEGRALSSRAALARGAAREPLLHHALLLRRLVARLQALGSASGEARGDVRDALSDVRELAAAPALGGAPLTSDGDSARELRLVGALRLLGWWGRRGWGRRAPGAASAGAG
jgi:hypothetical protein